MAGTLIITEELCWMPAGWAFNNVLERMASCLKDKDKELADRLLDSRTDVNGGYCDLSKCDANQFLKLNQAAEDAYAQFEKEGPESFYDPEFFPGFMERFRELRQMLRAR